MTYVLSLLQFIIASNCSDESRDLRIEVECLRKLPAEILFDKLTDLATAATRRRVKRLTDMTKGSPQWPVPFLSDAAQYFDVYMRPVIDGSFIPDCPTHILNSISEAPEALIGSVANEGMYWLLYGLGINGITFLHPNGSVTKPTVEELRNAKIDYFKLVQTRFMSIGQLVNPFPAIATAQYGFNSPGVQQTFFNTSVPVNEIVSTMDFLNRLDDLSGELDFVCATILFARLLSNIEGSKIQYYNFMHKTVGSQFPSWTGTMHGYEIEYVFGMPFSNEFKSKHYNFTEEEAALSRRIMRYWANFARTG